MPFAFVLAHINAGIWGLGHEYSYSSTFGRGPILVILAPKEGLPTIGFVHDLPRTLLKTRPDCKR